MYSHEIKKSYYDTGELMCIEHYVDKQLGHPGDEPARITFHKNGAIDAIEFYKNDQIHRDNSWAYCCYDKVDGSVQEMHYYQNGRLHRKDGPAMIEYFMEDLVDERWFKRGLLHNPNGPSIITYRITDGNVSGCSYHKNGKQLDSDAFEGIEPGTPEFQFQWDMMA